MDLIAELERSKQETLSFFDLKDAYLAKTYAPDKWCVKELLHHLADAETVLYERIRRVISEPKQVIWGFQQDLWAKELNYKELDLAANKAVYTAVRDMVISLAKTHYESLADKPFVHSETGLRTLKDEFDKVALHNENHLKQIRTALNL